MFLLLLFCCLFVAPSVDAAYNYNTTSITILRPDSYHDPNSSVLFNSNIFKTTANLFLSIGFSVWTKGRTESCASFYISYNNSLKINASKFTIYGNDTNNITVIRHDPNYIVFNLYEITMAIRYSACPTKNTDTVQWSSLFNSGSLLQWETGIFFVCYARQCDNEILEMRRINVTELDRLEYCAPRTYALGRQSSAFDSVFSKRDMLAIMNQTENDFLERAGFIGWMCARGNNDTMLPQYVWECGENFNKTVGAAGTFSAWGPGEPSLPDGCLYFDRGVWVTKDCASDQSVLVRSLPKPYIRSLYGEVTVNVVNAPTSAPTDPPSPTPTNATETPIPPTPAPTPKRVYRRITMDLNVEPAAVATESSAGVAGVISLSLGSSGKATMGEMIRQMYSCGTEEIFQVGVAIHPTQIAIGKKESYSMHLGAVVMDLVLSLACLGLYYFFNRHMVQDWDRWIDKFPHIGLVGLLYFYQTLCYTSTRV